MLDTIVAFIVMQKFELMLDAEQFGSRSDTMDWTVGPGTKYANSADVGAGPDKNNKRERLHVFIHRWIHKNIHSEHERANRGDQNGSRDEPKRKEKTPRGVSEGVLFSRYETVRPLYFVRIDR